MYTKKLVDVFIENVGLFNNIFGDNTEKIIFDRDREKAKLMLINVYGYDENKVNLLWPSEIDESRLSRTLETMFRFSNSNNIEATNNNNNNIK